jgi:hydroxymethylglutaryl-CoA lyase
MSSSIKIIECPRDAMQGIVEFIPTSAKITYINSLLKCGFDTIDFGSFVSPKAIPQLRDTALVLKGLELTEKTKLLAIVANERGAKEALEYDEINCIGFPFSISEQFQLRNTNSSISAAFETVSRIQDLVTKKNKTLIVYLSMGFGNPYGDEWSPTLALTWAEKLTNELGINTLALSDTIGCATAESVRGLFEVFSSELPGTELGAHFHVKPNQSFSLLDAAFGAGCRRFDVAFKGMGGCPMAKDELTGNLATEELLNWMTVNNLDNGLDKLAFSTAEADARRLFEMN